MGWLIWAGVLPICVLAAAFLLARPVRAVVEELSVDRARTQFHRRREWLEVRFLVALGPTDSLERLRWEEARWSDAVVWARDRQSRRLLALVGVEFEAGGNATALFEYRHGRWRTDGKRLDETRPDEAFLNTQRFEPLARPHRRV